MNRVPVAPAPPVGSRGHRPGHVACYSSATGSGRCPRRAPFLGAMKRLYLLGFVGLLSSILAGCPISPRPGTAVAGPAARAAAGAPVRWAGRLWHQRPAVRITCHPATAHVAATAASPASSTRTRTPRAASRTAQAGGGGGARQRQQRRQAPAAAQRRLREPEGLQRSPDMRARRRLPHRQVRRHRLHYGYTCDVTGHLPPRSKPDQCAVDSDYRRPRRGAACMERLLQGARISAGSTTCPVNDRCGRQVRPSCKVAATAAGSATPATPTWPLHDAREDVQDHQRLRRRETVASPAPVSLRSSGPNCSVAPLVDNGCIRPRRRRSSDRRPAGRAA